MNIPAPTPAALGALAQELTVGETYFLRNIDQFHALREQVWPERLRRGEVVPVAELGDLPP